MLPKTIRCTLGYPTITVPDVWNFFGDHELWFTWKSDAPEALRCNDGPSSMVSDLLAFMHSVKMLYTAEGLIFVTFNRKHDRPHTVISDIMGHIADSGSHAYDGVMVYAYHYLEDDGSVRTNDCMELSTIITKEYFESQVENNPGFRALIYDDDQYFPGGHMPNKQ